MNRWAAVAVVALAVVAACSAPTAEDHRRVAILSREAILEFDAEAIEPVGPVNTVLGHGDGPAVVANEASRDFTSSLRPPDIIVLPIDDHFRSVRMTPATHDVRISMKLSSNRAGTD